MAHPWRPYASRLLIEIMAGARNFPSRASGTTFTILANDIANSVHAQGVVPPSEYRDKQACDQANCLDADLYRVLNRRGISMRNAARQPVQQIRIKVGDLSLGKAIA
jgi:hypothetical protein